MKLECGHWPPKIEYTSTGFPDRVTPFSYPVPTNGANRFMTSSYSLVFAYFLFVRSMANSA